MVDKFDAFADFRLDGHHLAVEDIDHTRTKTRHPQTNGICERFHKTILNDIYRLGACPSNQS